MSVGGGEVKQISILIINYGPQNSAALLQYVEIVDI